MSEHIRPSLTDYRKSFALSNDGGGMGKAATLSLSVDRAMMATGRVMKTTPFRLSTDETLDFGVDTGPRSSSVAATTLQSRS